MPIYMDRHELDGVSPSDVAEAHRRDVEVQGKYGVTMITYWYDPLRGTVFCLMDAPDVHSANCVHREAHGGVAASVIEVELSAVQAFLGRIADPALAPAEVAITEPALRIVMFTDIISSTELTGRLGDERGVEMVRAHDAVVRTALRENHGREVKHTGDGIMAAFNDAASSIDCACSIMRGLETFNRGNREPIHLRIGAHVGEPVQDSNDLFGATVQLASRICQDAAVDAVVISDDLNRLVNDRHKTTELGRRMLKGFREPVQLYSVAWQ